MTENKPHTALSQDNQPLFDFIGMLQHDLQISKDTLATNVDTELAASLRERLDNPVKAMLNDALRVNRTVAVDILANNISRVIINNDNVLHAKNIVDGGTITFFLVLGEDNEQVRDPFYQISYGLLSSDLGQYYKAHFYYISKEVLDQVKGNEVK